MVSSPLNLAIRPNVCLHSPLPACEEALVCADVAKEVKFINQVDKVDVAGVVFHNNREVA